MRRVNEAAFGRPDEARIVDGLRDAGLILLSLVAEDNGSVIGNIVFSSLNIADTAARLRVAALGPLAVSPHWQCRGVGSELVRRGIALMKDAGIDLLCVYGGSYYARFGFEPAERLGILPSDEAILASHFQALALSETVPSAPLSVRYSPQFFAAR